MNQEILEKKMNASALGRVELDQERLSAELKTVDSEFPFNISYNRYARGNPGWKNCVLRNHTGDYNDVTFQGSYPGMAKLTELGKQTPYINELIDRTFHLEHLKWARIFWCHNGLLMPHRDYLDIEDDDFSRIHIVLQTDLGARHSEEERCYHMRQGEIWFVDGKYVHCASAYSDRPRINVVMDFEPGIPYEELFKDKSAHDENIEPHWLDREPFTSKDLEDIYSLSKIATTSNWGDISAIVGKVHFHKDVTVHDVYDWLHEIASRSGNEVLVERSVEMKKFFIGE